MKPVFADQGTPVDMVAVGNEVTNGMLWPNGEIYKNNTQDWTDFADLLKAGVSGAKAGNPRNHDLKIMIHTDLGGNNPEAVYFYKHILAQGVKFDVIGLSYYPFWHGPVIDMEKNIDELATQFKKPIVLAETQYPWTTANGDSTPDFVNSNTRLPAGYPATPKGQASFVRDLVSDVTAVPQHLGAGVFYWEPAWLPGVGWEPGAGTSNDNLTLFNWQGQALPAVDSYQIGWRR